MQNSAQVFEKFIDSGKVSMLSIQRLMPLQGGIPLYIDGQFMGTIGVSCCPGGHLDEQVVLYAVKKFHLTK
ncbi:hypothetical protein CTY88_10250 [Acinetobacter seifertii]|nr:hypothetical protein [Acinetobacter seifertii]